MENLKEEESKKEKKLGVVLKNYKCYFVFGGILLVLLLALVFIAAFASDDIFSRENPLAADDPRAVQYLRDHQLTSPPPASEPYNFKCAEPSCGTKKCVLKTYNKEKTFVLRLLKNMRNGFFIQSGSSNGEYMSDTIYLEKDYNWSGLLIEPDQAFFNETKKVNRKVWLSNTCLSCSPNPRKRTFHHTGKSHPNANKTLKISMKNGTNEIEKSGAGSSAIVECFPLYTYLLALNVTQIDYLSINTAESYKVLANFPFDKITIKVMKVDTKKLKVPVEELVKFLEKKNMFLVYNSASKKCVKDYLFAQASIILDTVQ